jgi:hypothetical protein
MDEPDAGQATAGDPKHLGACVNSYGRMAPPQELEVSTGSARDIEPGRSTARAKAPRDGFESPGLTAIVLASIEGVVVSRQFSEL